ncbi:1-deoxy-D-xylulose-5-phosphate reductoisomerase [bacterium]|nr:MAG: 1-deoxy-D-xylulose-5-phosphate reductoisomerase [bacterium]
MKRVAILGSTGSIGKTTLDIIKQHKKEFVLEALTANNNIAALKKQIAEFKPGKVAVVDEEAGGRLRSEANIKRGIYSGTEGLCRIASDEEVDVVVLAISGSAALGPLLAAINAGKTIALANKEALVMAGEIIMRRLKNSKARIIPVDSEQSAIFQCLEGREHAELRRVYLTASGGPLYNVPLSEFSSLSREEILAHPRWRMGRKITVDSATLMNKGLEVIEARWLFDIDVSAIGVLIHRQAIIHSMVEFLDGIVLAQLGVTDMALPIQYALSYPRRLPNKKYNLNFLKVGQLSFEKADTEKFPCLGFAYQAAKDSGSAPAAMNAANEEAVKAFLDKRISFVFIPKVIEKIMSKHKAARNPDLKAILETDRWAREEARRLIGKCSHF